eukprot:TRINITY_DN1539_c1_g1_i1.p1 TRINITY_DN1539_c1_g1~~TRINITY_DN1539_c1_g1_i1.p1  ORF type:complete len:144 (+),score=54.77 TRINITY_DN1539_c1_g1_i1:128-559(+)
MLRSSALRLAGTQPASVRVLEQIPLVGSTMIAASNPGTYAELAELRKEADPAAAVTARFVENQKHLVAYRIHRMRTEYTELMKNPFAMDGATPLALARTVALSLAFYVVGYYYGSGGYGVDLPGVGIVLGKAREHPVEFWAKK